MSIQFNWNLLTASHATLLRDFLNAKIAAEQASHPVDFVGPIRVTEVDFGKTAPQIEIQSLSDPYAVIAQSLHVFGSASSASSASPASTLSSPPASTSTAVSAPSTTSFSSPLAASSTSTSTSTAASAPAPLSSPPSPMSDLFTTVKDPEIVQLEFLVSYIGDFNLTVQGEVQVNLPIPAFISLPLTLGVTGFAFRGRVIVAHNSRNNTACFSLVPHDRSASPLADLRLKTIIGDPNKKVLQNIEKLKAFIVEQVRKAMLDHVIFPKCVCVNLAKPGVAVG